MIYTALVFASIAGAYAQSYAQPPALRMVYEGEMCTSSLDASTLGPDNQMFAYIISSPVCSQACSIASHGDGKCKKVKECVSCTQTPQAPSDVFHAPAPMQDLVAQMHAFGNGSTEGPIAYDINCPGGTGLQNGIPTLLTLPNKACSIVPLSLTPFSDSTDATRNITTALTLALAKLSMNTPGGYFATNSCDNLCSHGCDNCEPNYFNQIDDITDSRRFGWPNAFKKRDTWFQEKLNACANAASSYSIMSRGFTFQVKSGGCAPGLAAACVSATATCKIIGPTEQIIWQNTVWPPLPLFPQWHSNEYLKNSYG
jgi:hypothetical protein